MADTPSAGDTGRSRSEPIHYSTAFDRGKTPVACGRTEMPKPATNEWRYVGCEACRFAGAIATMERHALVYIPRRIVIVENGGYDGCRVILPRERTSPVFDPDSSPLDVAHAFVWLTPRELGIEVPKAWPPKRTAWAYALNDGVIDSWFKLFREDPELPGGITAAGRKFLGLPAATHSPAKAESPSRHPNESTEDFCRRVADWAGVAPSPKESR